MQNTERYYQESGIAPVNGLVATIAAAVGAAALLGVLYGILSFINPFIYVNFLGAIFLGIGLGLVVGKVGYWRKVRNSKLIMLTGVIAGLVGLYAAWVGWVYALTDYSTLILNPVEILDLMSVISTEGVYSIFGFVPTGFVLFAIWGIEAVIIVGGTFLNVNGSVGRQPFCEESEEWTTEEMLLDNLAPVSKPSALIADLERREFQSLMELPLIPGGREFSTKVSILHVPGRSTSAKYLSVDAIKLEWDDDGTPSAEVTPIVDNLILNSSEFDDLKRWKDTKLAEGLNQQVNNPGEAS